MVEFEKFNALAELNQGDKLQISNGEEVEFVRLKRKKFIGVIKGQTYDIPVQMFTKVLEKVDIEEEQNKKDKEIATLQKGEYFYIKSNSGEALLFQFESVKGDKIIGKNIITGVGTRISKVMYEGKVSNLVK